MKANKKYVAPDGLQYCMIPFTKLNITQGANMWSHTGCMAIDVTNGDGSRAPYYAPCDLVCKAIYPSYGQSWWQSLDNVHFSNGTKGILNIMIAHDNTQDCFVGQRVPQGSQIANMGDKGIGTGVHAHIQVGIGKNVTWGNVKGSFSFNGVNYPCYGFNNEPYDLDDVFYVNDTTILNGYGGNWRKTPSTSTAKPVEQKPVEQKKEDKPNYEKNVKYRGIDISSHNVTEGIDFDKPDFVIIRATYGTNTDKSFLEHVKQCKAHKKQFGVYCYSYALDDEGAKSEAEYLVKLLKDNGIVPGLGIWYDLEDADHYKEKNGFDYAKEKSICKTFCDYVTKQKYYVGVYTTKYWNEKYVKTDKPLWVANWGTNDGNVQGDFSDIAVMHQYTSAGGLDKNVLYVGFEAFQVKKEETQKQEQKQEPQKAEKPKEQWVDTVVKIGDTVKTNGLSIQGVSGDCVRCDSLGGYVPLADIEEYDASDGKLDGFLATTKAKIYLKPCVVQDVDTKHDLVKVHGYWVKPKKLLVKK